MRPRRGAGGAPGAPPAPRRRAPLRASGCCACRRLDVQQQTCQLQRCAGLARDVLTQRGQRHEDGDQERKQCYREYSKQQTGMQVHRDFLGAAPPGRRTCTPETAQLLRRFAVEFSPGGRSGGPQCITGARRSTKDRAVRHVRPAAQHAIRSADAPRPTVPAACPGTPHSHWSSCSDSERKVPLGVKALLVRNPAVAYCLSRD